MVAVASAGLAALCRRGSARTSVHARFTILWEGRGVNPGAAYPMLVLALSMFIGLFAFGHNLLGWHDPHGQVQMGLFMAFLFGIVCGYRTRG
jgi:hypothetical protein